MMDELEVFKRIGINSQEDANKAMAVFCKTFSALSEMPESEVWESFGNLEDTEEPADNANVNPTDEAKSTFKPNGVSERTINVWLVAKNLVRNWLTKEKRHAADRIAKMISDNQTDIEPVSDFVRIAAHVYGNCNDSLLTDQWHCLGNEYNGIKLDDHKSGLQAMLYKHDGDVARYVYAIAGTDPTESKDWLTNVGQVLGFSDQHDRAAEAAERLAQEVGIENLKFVGHSKGGGQAAYCALRTGCDAITFNPAGLGLYKFNLKHQTSPRIDSFVMTTDPLNIFQLAAQLIFVDITADGSVHYVKPTSDMPVNIESTHGINAFLHLLGLSSD